MAIRRVQTGLVLVLLCPIVALSVSIARAGVNPLESNERRVRLNAIELLQKLKPIEDHVLRTGPSTTSRSGAEKLVEISGDRVNLRSGPSTDAEVLAVGFIGEVYKYTRTEGDWHYVRIDADRHAYVSVQFSRLIDQSRSASQPATEEIDPEYRGKARKILGETAGALDELKRLGQDSERLFQRRYKNREAGENDAEFWVAIGSAKKIRKYVKGATRQHERLSALVGGGISRSKTGDNWMSTLQGTAQAGMGSNTAETQQSGSVTSSADATRSEIAADLQSDFSPNDRLGIDIGRTEEVHFAAIARTRAGIRYERKLGEKVQVSTNLGVSKYDNEGDDKSNIDESEFGVTARTQPTESFGADIGAAFAGSAYPNNKDLDFKDTRFNLGAGGKVSESSRWRVTYGHTSHDVDLSSSGDDNGLTRLTGDLTLKSGGSTTIGFSADAESRSFENANDTRTYSRYGLKVQMRGGNAHGSSQSGSLEYRAKSFDEDNDRNYSEFRGELLSHQNTTGGGRRAFALTGNYHSFKGDAAKGFLNYIESRMDVLREPGNGMFWESNIYGQYFFNKKEFERNPVVTQFVWLGLVIGRNGAFKVGPHVAANTTLLTTDSPDGGVFEDPSNTIRYGVKGSINIRSKPVRVRGSGRYELLNYYNVDNSSTPSRFELRGDGTYDINSQFGVSVILKYFTTGSDDQNAIETSEFDLLLSLIYRLGGPPSR